LVSLPWNSHLCMLYLLQGTFGTWIGVCWWSFHSPYLMMVKVPTTLFCYLVLRSCTGLLDSVCVMCIFASVSNHFCCF
jgi:hypothetical protein